MDMVELIDMYRNKLEHDPYSCLLFALQLPSICSRVEYKEHPNLYDGCWSNKYHKLLDGLSYRRWLTRHIFYLKPLFMPFMSIKTFVKKVYRFRCLLTHEGVLLDQSGGDNDFCFVDGDNTFALPNVLFLSLSSFCTAMFDSARLFLVNSNIRLDVSLYPELLLPSQDYIKIMNDVRRSYSEWIARTFEYTDDYDDGLLCILYDWLNVYYRKSDKSDKAETNELEKIDKFFKKNPDNEYIVIDFCRRCASISDVKRLYIKERPSMYGLLYSKTFNLHLTKKDYERMLYLHIRSLWFYKATLKEKIDSYFKQLDVDKST